MKRIVNIALCLVILTVFSGCSRGQSSQKHVKTVKEILQSVIKKSDDKTLDETAYFDDEIFQANCEKLYGIEFSELADGGIMYVSDGSFADEISIIKLKENRHRAESIFKKRVEKRAGDFTGYKPTELAKIEKAKMIEKNGFAVLIISDSADSLMKIIENEIS